MFYIWVKVPGWVSYSNILSSGKDLPEPCAEGIQRPGSYWWFVPKWPLLLLPPSKGAKLANEGGTLAPWTSWSLQE